MKNILISFFLFFSMNLFGQNELSKEKMVIYLYNVYYWDDDRDQCLYGKIEELCFEILELDSMNQTANYHLGLLYYNEAVFLNASKEKLSEEEEKKARDFLARSNIYFSKVEDIRHSSSPTDE